MFLFALSLLCAGCGNKEVKKAPAAAVPGKLEVQRYGYPAETADRAKILSMLRAKQYADLDTLIDSYQKLFEKDFHNEFFMWDAFESFNISDPSLQPLLEDWVQRDPGSWVAHASLSNYYQSRGWDARGEEYGDKTSAAQFHGMEEWFKKASEQAHKALALNAKAVIGDDVLISIAQTEGDLDECRRLFDEEMKVCPLSFGARTAYMFVLRPRWEGSYDQMEQFAEESQKLVKDNPKLRVLRGYVAWDKATLAVGEKDYKGALELLNTAASFGDHWVFFSTRSGVLRLLKRMPEAILDINRALALRPQSVPALTERVLEYTLVRKYKDAAVDLKLAIQIDPTNAQVKSYQESYHGRFGIE